MADKIDFFQYISDAYDFLPPSFKDKYRVYWDGLVKQYANLFFEILGTKLGLSLENAPVYDRRQWKEFDTSIQFDINISKYNDTNLLIKTDRAHNLSIGRIIRISDTSYDNDYEILDIVSTDSFRVEGVYQSGTVVTGKMEIVLSEEIIPVYVHDENRTIPLAVSGPKMLDFTGIEQYAVDIKSVSRIRAGEANLVTDAAVENYLSIGDEIAINKKGLVVPASFDDNSNWFDEINPAFGNLNEYVFSGTGTDDISIPLANFLANQTVKREVTIRIVDGVSNPNTFEHSIDGAPFTGPINCNTTPVHIGDDIYIGFDAITGHDTGDEWSFLLWPQSHVTNSIPWVVTGIQIDQVTGERTVSVTHDTKESLSDSDPNKYEMIIGTKYLCTPNIELLDKSKYLVAFHDKTLLPGVNWRNVGAKFPKLILVDGIVVNNYMANDEAVAGKLILNYMIKVVRQITRVTAHPQKEGVAIYHMTQGTIPGTYPNADYYPETNAFMGTKVDALFSGCGPGNNGNFVGRPIGHDRILVENPEFTATPEGEFLSGFAISSYNFSDSKRSNMISNFSSEHMEVGDFIYFSVDESVNSAEKITGNVVQLKNEVKIQLNGLDSEIYLLRQGVDRDTIVIEKYIPGAPPTYENLTEGVDYIIIDETFGIKALSNKMATGSLLRVSYKYLDNVTHLIDYPYSFPIDENIVSIEGLQNFIDEDFEGERTTLSEDTDYQISESHLCFKESPPVDRLWAPFILIDQKRLYRNFGFLINLNLSSSEEYRNTILGIWKALFFGPARGNIRKALYLLLGFPITVTAGTIQSIDRAGGSITILNDDGTTTVYGYNPVLGLFDEDLIKEGNQVEKFQELSKGIEVIYQYTNPNFMDDVATESLEKYYTQNITPEDEAIAKDLLSANLWQVIISESSLQTDTERRAFLSNFLDIIKPPHTDYLLTLVRPDEEDKVDLIDMPDVFRFTGGGYRTIGHGTGGHGTNRHGDTYFTAYQDKLTYYPSMTYNWLGTFAIFPPGTPPFNVGDAFRLTLNNKNYICINAPGSNPGDWIEMIYLPRLFSEATGEYMFKSLGVAAGDEVTILTGPNATLTPYIVDSIPDSQTLVLKDGGGAPAAFTFDSSVSVLIGLGGGIAL